MNTSKEQNILYNLLYTLFSLDDLKKLCEKFGLKKTGNKRDLALRIATEIEISSPEGEYLMTLIRKQLRKLKKEEIIEILKKIGLQEIFDDDQRYKKDEIIQLLLDVILLKKKKEPVKTIPTNILFKLARELEKIDISTKINSESELKAFLIGRLKASKKYDIIEESAYSSLEDRELGIEFSKADIMVKYKDYTIPVELKYIKDRKNATAEIQRGLGQSVIYKKHYGGAILLIYDASKKITNRPKIVADYIDGIYIVLR